MTFANAGVYIIHLVTRSNIDVVEDGVPKMEKNRERGSLEKSNVVTNVSTASNE